VPTYTVKDYGLQAFLLLVEAEAAADRHEPHPGNGTRGGKGHRRAALFSMSSDNTM
jgi:hypothetical protein